MRPIITPTPINKTPETTLVIRTEFGDDRKDLTLERNKIINMLPIIGTEKDTIEIITISKKLIVPKLKKLGSRVR